MPSPRVALGVLVALLVALGVGWWQGGQSARETNASELAAINGARLADAQRWARDSSAIATRAREEADRLHRIELTRLRARVRESEGIVLLGREALADTAATVETLHTALTASTEALELAAMDMAAHIVKDSLHEIKVARERELLIQSLIYSDSIGGHWKAEAQRIAKASQCRVLFIPCPTRTQSAVIGAGITVAVIVLAGR